MNDTTEQTLYAVYQTLVIEQPNMVVFCGKHHHTQSTTYQTPAQTREAPNATVRLIQNLLYQYVYAQPFTGELPEAPTIPPESFGSLLPYLATANTSQSYWDDGWQIERVTFNGAIIASKKHLRRQVQPGEYISLDGMGSGLRPGSPIRLFFANESSTVQPGFYFVFWETPEERFSGSSVLRFYWNLIPDGAPQLVSLISQRLSSYQVPFHLKCLTTPGLYSQRADSAVLFVKRRHHRIISELAADVYQEMLPFLQPGTPTFTRFLAPGLALAEDPGNGESFGMSRCRIIAEGIWDAYSSGTQVASARSQAVDARFAHYGIDRKRPYLNARSPYEYTFPYQQEA